MQFRLIVGLGNPGREYRDTRHNVGFMIADRLAAAARAEFKHEKSWQCDLARTGGAMLCKPLTYMNLSGEAVRAVCDFYKIEPAAVLAISDDMALPLGKLRLRSGGSAGGHNGLKSIASHLGTQEFPRLRIGIGSSTPGEATGHVLGRFSDDEKAALDDSLARAISAIDCAQSEGFAAAMNSFN